MIVIAVEKYTTKISPSTPPSHTPPKSDHRARLSSRSTTFSLIPLPPQIFLHNNTNPSLSPPHLKIKFRMHILVSAFHINLPRTNPLSLLPPQVVNDDGPPSNQSSPYVHSLVKTLQAAGHTVSVVLPHTQRSWIGKAHIIGQTVKPTYFRPGTLHKDDGTTHSRPLATGSKEQEEWVLVDGTPASCVQIGLYHY